MNYEKLAPELISLCEDYRSSGRESLSSYSTGIGVTNLEKPLKRPGVPVFIKCEWEGDLSSLEARGIRCNQKNGTIRTAYLPVEELEFLSDDPRIQRIEPSQKLKLLMDEALPQVRVPQFRAATGASGRNVVIGIVDSGIDPRHPAFQGRIHSIWDQTLDGDGVPEGDFGMEFTGASLAGSRDTDGHGTHVAGIAAASDPVFSGVAPEATLVIVKTQMFLANAVQGVEYIFRIARELGRPAVVNLSLGSHADSHDGTDLACQRLNQMSGPGRIICVAAGNEGEEKIHAKLTVRAGETRSVSFLVPNGVGECVLNCWYPGGDRIETRVQNPQRNTTTFQGPIVNGSPRRAVRLSNSTVVVTTPGRNSDNGDQEVSVRITNGGNPIPAGIWRLQFRGAQVVNGRIDAWITNERLGSFVDNVDDSLKIGAPGCASAVITVGSFNTKNEFTNRAGAPREVDSTPGEISSFSSEGPLRNGALKPDVAAPGAFIVAALSSDISFSGDPATIRQKQGQLQNRTITERFVVNQGTSMAAPFIAGLVALLLERNASLDPPAVKALLRSSSSVPGGASGQHDIRWGFGRIDAERLIDASASSNVAVAAGS